MMKHVWCPNGRLRPHDVTPVDETFEVDRRRSRVGGGLDLEDDLVFFLRFRRDARGVDELDAAPDADFFFFLRFGEESTGTSYP